MTDFVWKSRPEKPDQPSLWLIWSDQPSLILSLYNVSCDVTTNEDGSKTSKMVTEDFEPHEHDRDSEDFDSDYADEPSIGFHMLVA